MGGRGGAVEHEAQATVEGVLEENTLAGKCLISNSLRSLPPVLQKNVVIINRQHHLIYLHFT
jgi:hypothetical protein